MQGMRGGKRFDDVGRCLTHRPAGVLRVAGAPDLCKAYGRVIRADVNRCVVVPPWHRARRARVHAPAPARPDRLDVADARGARRA